MTGKRKLDTEAQEEDILTRFTDPEKKRKKRAKKSQALKELHQKNVMSGKELAKDHFNDTLKVSEISLLSSQTLEVSRSDVQNMLDTVSVSDIGYSTQIKSKKGMICVFEFIVCANHCQQWLNEQMTKIGWKQNMTNYNPISASHSPPEVLQATVECYQMACKQMLRYLESVSDVVPTI